MIATWAQAAALCVVPALDEPGLLFHDPPPTPAHEEVVELVRERLGSDTQRRGWSAADEASPVSLLDLYERLEREDRRLGWLLTFEPAVGMIRFDGLDRELGVFARRGVRIALAADGELSDGHRRMLRQCADGLRETLRSRRQAASSTAPDDAEILWRSIEDPPTPGFRWRYEGNEAVISLVYAGTSIAAAGLRSGDRLLAINGTPIDGPAHLGRALGPLRPRDGIEVRVERGDGTRTCVGQVERSSVVIPRWQRALVGERLVPLPAAFGDLGELDGRAVVLHAFALAQPDSWLDLAALRSLRDHPPVDRVAIVALALGSPASVRKFVDESGLEFPTVACSDELLRRALRVHDFPTTLVIDAGGHLRLHGVPSWSLRPVLREIVGKR